jgi:hypothetical protein
VVKVQLRVSEAHQCADPTPTFPSVMFSLVTDDGPQWIGIRFVPSAADAVFDSSGRIVAQDHIDQAPRPELLGILNVIDDGTYTPQLVQGLAGSAVQVAAGQAIQEHRILCSPQAETSGEWHLWICPPIFMIVATLMRVVAVPAPLPAE